MKSSALLMAELAVEKFTVPEAFDVLSNMLSDKGTKFLEGERELVLEMVNKLLEEW